MSGSDWRLRAEYGWALPLMASLPRRAAYAWADRRSLWVMRRRSESRAMAARNLARVFPEMGPAQIDECVRRHFRVQSRDELESFWYERPLSYFQQFVEVSGLELLRQAVRAEKGVLLFSGHVGCTGIFFVVMGRHGIRLNIIGRPLDPEQVPLPPAVTAYAQRRVSRIEAAVGEPFLLTGRGNYPLMRQKLERGEVLMILIDVIPMLLKRTVPVDFLGRRCLFGDGIAALHQATGARLLEWNIHQDLETDIHRIEICDPGLGGVHQGSNQEIMQHLAGRVEARIRQHPEDWSQWDSLTHFERA